MCYVQLIFSILRHTFISKAYKLVMSSFLIVLISALYKVTLQISIFTSFFSILPLVFFPPGKGSFPIAIQGRQSWGLRVAGPPHFAGGGGGGGRRGCVLLAIPYIT